MPPFKHNDQAGKCDFCGEMYDQGSDLPSEYEVAEFVVPDISRLPWYGSFWLNKIGHVTCGQNTEGAELA